MTELLALSWEVARDTAAYLFAFWLVPVWAFLAQVALLRIGARWRAGPWLESTSPWRRGLGAAALGVLRPFWRPALARNLRSLAGRPAEIVIYLAASHALTVYYFFLMGPLLGKDVLLSHVVGGLLFVLFGASLAAWWLEADRPPAEAAPGDGVVGRGGRTEIGPGEEGWNDEERPGLFALAGGELGRVGAMAVYGLALGALVGGWGLTAPGFVPAEIPGPAAAVQGLNALLGLGAAVVAWMWPVGTLFLGTYLWKVGLAHAGLVAFFYACAVSPQRVRLYARVLGPRRAVRLSAALAVAALLAGLATALLFGLSSLEIRYKLTPAQMW